MLTDDWDFVIKRSGFFYAPDLFADAAGEVREAYMNMTKAFEAESNLVCFRGANLSPSEIEKVIFSKFWNWLMEKSSGFNEAALLFLYAMGNEMEAHFDGRVYVETTEQDQKLPIRPVEHLLRSKHGQTKRRCRKMAKVSGNTHTQAQMNHYANQNNPNNPAHKATSNNHANQCNPNKDAHHGRKK